MKRLLLLLLLVFPALAWASDSLGAARAGLVQALEDMAASGGFRCGFEQDLMFSDGTSMHYSGDIAVLQPGRFRWKYQRPYEQLYVGDGKIIWHYEPDLMQVQRLRRLENVDPLVMRLLDGRMQPRDVRLLEHEEEQEIIRYRIKIGNSDPVWLGLHRDHTLAYVENHDALGNRNRITFTHCRFIAPAAKLFSFSPPEGVDVVDID